MAIDVPTFRARFPEFTDPPYSDERIQLFIDDTLCYMGEDESRWCGCYDTAQAYLTAHLLALGTASAMGDSAAQAGPLLSAAADGVSYTRAGTSNGVAGSDEFYASTAYGQRFLSLRARCIVPVAVANCL